MPQQDLTTWWGTAVSSRARENSRQQGRTATTLSSDPLQAQADRVTPIPSKLKQFYLFIKNSTHIHFGLCREFLS